MINVQEMTKAEKALALLWKRNPIRNDRQAYEFQLACWGLGLEPDFPNAGDFGQEEILDDRLQAVLDGYGGGDK